MSKLKTSREYSKAVLGKAATDEQIEEMFSLCSTACPVVSHGQGEVETYRGRKLRRRTTVEILSYDADGPATLAKGFATCNEDLDQWNRRRGVAIAFARALEALRHNLIAW